MLHWSQEASTGWTRNSWFGSIAKVEDVPFCAFAPGGAGQAPTSRFQRGESTIPLGSGAKKPAVPDADLTCAPLAATLRRKVVRHEPVPPSPAKEIFGA
jgi:hypothetical protein